MLCGSDTHPQQPVNVNCIRWECKVIGNECWGACSWRDFSREFGYSFCASANLILADGASASVVALYGHFWMFIFTKTARS
jgi:hypothetical protein